MIHPGEAGHDERSQPLPLQANAFKDWEDRGLLLHQRCSDLQPKVAGDGYLGNRIPNLPNSNGVPARPEFPHVVPIRRGRNHVVVRFLDLGLPRVGVRSSRQPWAEGRNTFGVENHRPILKGIGLKSALHPAG